MKDGSSLKDAKIGFLEEGLFNMIEDEAQAIAILKTDKEKLLAFSTDYVQGKISKQGIESFSCYYLIK